MNPFTDLSPRRPRPAWLRFLGQPALLLFAASLAVGLAVVVWRAVVRCNSAHALARAEVQARAAALEAQLNQVPAAAEALGALARQSRGGVPDFQKVAKELHERYPGLASLELQPGGIVSEIVPREGNERAIGVSVLRDRNQGPGAKEAMAQRALSVCGPVQLYRGEQGVVARVPVFQRTPDGREAFWGFVAAAMRFQDALVWTQVNQLPGSGYGYAFYLPSTARQQGLILASSWLSALQEVEQQELRVQGLKFRLALKRRGGWLDKTELASEALVALLVATLVAFLAWVLTGRRALEAELAQAAERLAQEQAKRTAAETTNSEKTQRMGAAQAELEQARHALEEANARAAQLESRLEASVREREGALQLQERKQKEVEGALARAQETIAQLQTQPEAAKQAEKSTAATAAERLQQSQAALAELRAKLEAATRSARDTAKATAAELAQWQESDRELKARLAKAEQAEARVAELEGLLQTAQEELNERSLPAPEEVETAPAEPEVPSLEPEVSFGPAASPADVPAADVQTEPVATPVDEAPQESPAEPPAAEPEPAASMNAEEPPAPEAAPASPAAPQVEVAVMPVPPEEPVKAEASAEPVAAPKPPSKPSRRRKAARNAQMDLFGGGHPAAEAPAKAAEPAGEPQASSKAEKPVSANRLPAPPPVDVAELRKAVHQILPLLVDQDPGAKDCLRDNRTTFRSAFTPEGYAEFEQLLKQGESGPALESLKKAARKHGITV